MPRRDPRAHAVRAARMDTRDLEQRLRRLAHEQQSTRETIAAELRREHFGRLPDSWHGNHDAPNGRQP
jgi:hypothetical protein